MTTTIIFPLLLLLLLALGGGVLGLPAASTTTSQHGHHGHHQDLDEHDHHDDAAVEADEQQQNYLWFGAHNLGSRISSSSAAVQQQGIDWSPLPGDWWRRGEWMAGTGCAPWATANHEMKKLAVVKVGSTLFVFFCY
jgi:hypothetical protein